MVERIDVAIVGGGIAGLTLAYRLMSYAPNLRVALFEASGRLGGKVLTEQIDHDAGRFVVEAGPDAFLTQKPWARELSEELGIADRLIPVNAMPRPVAILKHGRLVDLPEGVALIGPVKILPFLRSPLLSPTGKLRAMIEPLIPRSHTDGDEALGRFVRRRFGSEALDWIAEPLAAGVYNADPERLSTNATFPRFRELERAHGSLIHALRAAEKQRRGDHSPVFLSFKNGMQELVDTLVTRIGSVARTDSPVESIQRTTTGYLLSVPGRLVEADALVLAASATDASRLLTGIAPIASSALSELRSLPAGTLSLAVRGQEMSRSPSGYGVVVPRREGGPFNAVTISSRKFDERAPEGWTSIRLFFGGTRSPVSMELDDDRLIATALEQLHQWFGIESKPAFTRIHRWDAGSPQYDVGHLDRVAMIRASLPEGIQLLGSPYTGVGIPDIVHAAASTADQLIAHRRPAVVV